MTKKVIVIGGGVAGMEAASKLVMQGVEVFIIEKEDKLGGHLLKWDRLFPNRRPAQQVLDYLTQGINAGVKVMRNMEVERIQRRDYQFAVYLSKGYILMADAILISTGFRTFDARRKEEYGYGIYENVITSVQLEEMFSSGESLLSPSGVIPKRVGVVHCVGSRDAKVGNEYCSRVCCVTAVKQAIELKEALPDTEVFCYYMDLRMFGIQFEALYKEAQLKGVNFIRGRLSEACENYDGSIVVKVEDTLAGKPLKMNVDLLVLMVGMEPSCGTRSIGEMAGVTFEPNGFIAPMDQHTCTNETSVPGIFMAGTCKAPASVDDVITDARAVALKLVNYLRSEDCRVPGMTLKMND